MILVNTFFDAAVLRVFLAGQYFSIAEDDSGNTPRIFYTSCRYNAVNLAGQTALN